MIEFEAFPKIARLNREIIVTEKLDGTNAQIIITEDGEVGAGSRTRLITPKEDNYGFATWVQARKDELLLKLGPGRHFGEWWGSGIQRGYGLCKGEKRFSLFNTTRWLGQSLPDGVFVVPELYRGFYKNFDQESSLRLMKTHGSYASPGFMNPEGIVIFHTAADQLFKVTLEKDEAPKATWQKR